MQHYSPPTVWSDDLPSDEHSRLSVYQKRIPVLLTDSGAKFTRASVSVDSLEEARLILDVLAAHLAERSSATLEEARERYVIVRSRIATTAEVVS